MSSVVCVHRPSHGLLQQKQDSVTVNTHSDLVNYMTEEYYILLRPHLLYIILQISRHYLFVQIH